MLKNEVKRMNILEVLRPRESASASAPLVERVRRGDDQSRHALYRSFAADEQAAAASSKESPLVRWAAQSLKVVVVSSNTAKTHK